MYISKSKTGYGWYSAVSTKEIGLENPAYIRFSFKKDDNPKPEELSEYGSVKGELYLHTASGLRKVFPVAKEYQGNVYIEYKILELEGAEKPVQSIRRQDVKTDIKDYDPNIISPEELPFY